MRHLLLAAVTAAALLGLGLSQARAGKVEVTGVHVCCRQCVTIATKVLGTVEGVTDAAASASTKIVSFTAKDDKAASAGVKALVDAGYFGACTHDGKELKLELPAPKAGEKADEVTVKNVHVCCNQCKTALSKLFPDAKLEYGTANDVKALQVKIIGKGLDKAAVVETLRKAGFNGTVE